MQLTAYIFKPSEKWGYCGGGLVIIADSFAGCYALLEGLEPPWTKKMEIHMSETSVPEDTDSSWVLVDSFLCDRCKPELVMCDYNWG